MKRRDPGDWIVSALVAFYAAVTLPMITAPVGLSHDGQNTGVFALAARALRQTGLVSSRGGSILAQGNGAYAHHPPSIVWATALSESVFGTHPWSSRLPTFLGSIAIIVLLYRLARALGFDSISAAVGTCVAVGNPMFFTYAWMLDTPMWSLPFALALITRWARGNAGTSQTTDLSAGTGPARGGRVGTGVLAALCALSGWQATLLCGGLIATTLLRRTVPDDTGRGRRADVLPIAIGATAGALITMAWIAASPEGISGLIESFSARTGESNHALSPSLADAVSAQIHWTTDVWLIPTLIALPSFALAAWRDRRSRLVAAASAATVMLYGALFWQAASIHDYWHFWAIVPIALGATALAARVRATHRQPVASSRMIAPLMIAVALAAPVWSASGRSDAQHELRAGWAIADLIARTPLATDQRQVVIGGIGQPWSWASYANSLDLDGLSGRRDLELIARRHPEWMVVLGCWSVAAACDELRSQGAAHVNAIVVAPAARILAAIQATSSTTAPASRRPR